MIILTGTRLWRKKMKLRVYMLIVLLAVLITAGSAAVAQEPSPQAETGIYGIPVDCTFTNQDFGLAVAELSKQSGVEILVDQTITGKVNINLGKTTLGNALDRICSLAGVFYDQAGEKSLVIASADPKGTYFKLVMGTVPVPVNNIKVGQLMRLLANNPFAQYIAIDEELNLLTITAPPSIITRLKYDIAQIDIPKKLVRVEAAFLDTSKLQQKDIGNIGKIIWGKTNANGIKTIIWNGLTVGVTDENKGEFNIFNTKTEDELKILSKPSLTVLDGEQAELDLSKLYYPYVTYFGQETVVKVEPIKAGSSLKIRPIINKETDEILVFFTAVAGEPVGTGSFGNPIVNNRSVTSTTRVKSGQSIIVAGLANQLDYKVYSKIPILGDIPLIGNIFRSSHKRNEKQEIAILITPTILGEGEGQPKIEKEIEKAKAKVEERAPVIEKEKSSEKK